MHIHRLGRDVSVLSDQLPAPGIGFVPVNAFVLHAAEPVVVDTGLPGGGFLDTLGSVVDPADVRWIWLTHPDRDHTGALFDLLDAAPRARLVTNFLSAGAMSTERTVPPNRLYLPNPGQSLDVGDRTLTAFRPPLYDSPATIGLYDDRSQTCFSSDCFGAPSQRRPRRIQRHRRRPRNPTPLRSTALGHRRQPLGAHHRADKIPQHHRAATGHGPRSHPRHPPASRRRTDIEVPRHAGRGTARRPLRWTRPARTGGNARRVRTSHHGGVTAWHDQPRRQGSSGRCRGPRVHDSNCAGERMHGSTGRGGNGAAATTSPHPNHPWSKALPSTGASSCPVHQASGEPPCCTASAHRRVIPLFVG
jgi:glyoxylase-like metal-dependent hydrolase (beta-lactamase superfamily II)